MVDLASCILHLWGEGDEKEQHAPHHMPMRHKQTPLDRSHTCHWHSRRQAVSEAARVERGGNTRFVCAILRLHHRLEVNDNNNAARIRSSASRRHQSHPIPSPIHQCHQCHQCHPHTATHETHLPPAQGPAMPSSAATLESCVEISCHQRSVSARCTLESRYTCSESSLLKPSLPW